MQENPTNKDMIASKRKQEGALTPQRIQEIALKAAGITPEELGRRLLVSLDKLESLTEAQKVIIVSGSDQEKGEQVRVPDNPTQVRAAKDLAELVTGLGGLRRRPPEEEKSDPKIVVDLSGWNVKASRPDSSDGGENNAPEGGG